MRTWLEYWIIVLCLVMTGAMPATFARAQEQHKWLMLEETVLACSHERALLEILAEHQLNGAAAAHEVLSKYDRVLRSPTAMRCARLVPPPMLVSRRLGTFELTVAGGSHSLDVLEVYLLGAPIPLYVAVPVLRF